MLQRTKTVLLLLHSWLSGKAGAGGSQPFPASPEATVALYSAHSHRRHAGSRTTAAQAHRAVTGELCAEARAQPSHARRRCRAGRPLPQAQGPRAARRPEGAAHLVGTQCARAPHRRQRDRGARGRDGKRQNNTGASVRGRPAAATGRRGMHAAAARGGDRDRAPRRRGAGVPGGRQGVRRRGRRHRLPHTQSIFLDDHVSCFTSPHTCVPFTPRIQSKLHGALHALQH